MGRDAIAATGFSLTQSFGHWNERIDAATDEHARRALLGEIGVWRAQRITDIPAQRTASFALSMLYALLGEGPPALNEARQMMALCRTPPNPPGEDMRFAEKHLARVERSFGPKPAGAPRAAAVQARTPAGRNAPRAERGAPSFPAAGPDPFDAAIAAVRAGRFDEARGLIGGLRGGRAGVLRMWSSLAEALSFDGEAREAALRGLERELAARFTEPERAERPERQDRAAPDAEPAFRTTGPLAALIGQVPTARDALVDAVTAYIAAHPEQIDAVAAAALQDHVAANGPRAVAPWLVGITGTALASGDGAATRRTLNELDGNWAVTAYSEPPFAWLVDVLRVALAAGWTLVSLRRGVLRKGAPGGRETWTLRLTKDGIERLIAAVPPTDLPDAAIAERLVARFSDLCDRVVLLVTEPGQAALADAGRALGFAVASDATSAFAALYTVGDHARVGLTPAPTEAKAPAAREPRPPREPRAPREDAAPRGPGPMDAVAEKFAAEPADVEAWSPLLATLDRGFKAFVAIRTTLETMAAEQLDARLAPLLEALHAVTPESVRLAEGISVAVRTAAAVPDGAVAALLARDDATAARYGGRASLTLAGIARALGASGWTVRRVLLGITRREQRAQAALAPLGRRVEGMWRLIVSRGAQAGEIWYVDAPSPEALAAAPLLLLEPRQRAFLVAPSFDGTLALPTEAIVWTGAEGDALVASIDAWPAATISDEDESA